MYVHKIATSLWLATLSRLFSLLHKNIYIDNIYYQSYTRPAILRMSVPLCLWFVLCFCYAHILLTSHILNYIYWLFSLLHRNIYTLHLCCHLVLNLISSTHQMSVLLEHLSMLMLSYTSCIYFDFLMSGYMMLYVSDLHNVYTHTGIS